MTTRTVLQKLLTAEHAAAIVEHGHDQVGGVVVDAAAAGALDTPDRILAAYGFPAGVAMVDVVRFEMPVLARASAPAPDATPRPWPTYPTGFLRGEQLVPVWQLSRTRYPYGAEYWRIAADGRQRCLSVYQGPARGWRGARGWRPASPLVGPRARWRGVEACADVVGDGLLLSLLGPSAPAGWEEVRPGAWAAAAPAQEAELYETVVQARVEGVPVRVLAMDRATAHVLLAGDDEAEAARVDAELSEPGVFEARVARERVSDLQVTESQRA